MQRKKVDIIIPVRDEEKNIPSFVQGIFNLNIPKSIELGIVFIEDNSHDQTLEILRKYSKENLNIEYYSLKNDFGQPAAVAFGLKQSEADAMIMMDVDGGHPVEVIPEMISHYKNGADIVQAIRKNFEKRRFYRKIGTLLFDLYLFLIAGINVCKQNVSYRLVSKEVNQKILGNYRWLYFFRTNFSRGTGIKEKYVYFSAKDRNLGESKYNFMRLFKVAIIAPLSVISFKRFICIIAALGLLIIICLIKGYIFFSIGILIFSSFLVFRFYKMSTANILNKLEIFEKSGYGQQYDSNKK